MSSNSNFEVGKNLVKRSSWRCVGPCILREHAATRGRGVSWWLLLNLDNLSVEEVTGHLRNVEQRKKTAASDRQGRLLLTEGKWRARTRSRNNAADGGGSARGFVEVFATFHSWESVYSWQSGPLLAQQVRILCVACLVAMWEWQGMKYI